MASTDTRSGFRLPWSADRSQDDTAFHAAGGASPEPEVAAGREPVAWPETDSRARADAPAPADDTSGAIDPRQEAPSAPSARPSPAPRKPTKLMADLAAAIRATAEAARDQRLGQLETDSDGIVGMIRAQSEEGAVGLRRRSDEDVAAIRDWAKAEIARIKEESEARIADRKHLLEQELTDHAAAIEDRCAEVQSTVAGYRRAMAAYFDRLGSEEDPARLATLVEAMPEPPALESLTDLRDLPVQGAAARHDADSAQAQADAEAEPAIAAAEPEAAGASSDGSDAAGEAEIMVSEDRIANALRFGDEAEAGVAESVAAVEDAGPAWGDGRPADEVAQRADDATAPAAPDWGEGGEQIDRAAILADLEAAAEAMVAAEAAADAPSTTEPAPDGTPDGGDTEALAYRERLASLLPADAEADPSTTQVVVTGLVSVASIASFKRHLGRLGGVTAVAVASGPDGEFIFNVTHRPDVPLRDAIPTLPGFAARVVATGDGTVSVTAHDPEAEA